jgi:hypothetical protein
MANAAVQANPVGAPAKIDDKTLAQLEEAFVIGCTDIEACAYADINPSTLYRYQDKYPKYSKRKEALKSMPTVKARKRIVQDIESENPWIATNAAKYVVDKVDGKARQTMHIQDDLTITVQRKTYDAIDEPEPCEVIDVSEPVDE